MEFKKNILSKQDIEKICLNYVHNNLYWYERETREFFKLVEKPLYLDQFLILEYIYNNLVRYDENILKNESLKNDNLQFPFSKLHKIVDYYFNNPDELFREVFQPYEDDTKLTDILDELFTEIIERLLKYNDNFENLNDNIQREVLQQFNIFTHLDKEDAMTLLKLLI